MQMPNPRNAVKNEMQAPMPTFSIDPLYPHWFRCDLCGQDVAEVLPAEALDLVNLTAG